MRHKKYRERVRAVAVSGVSGELLVLLTAECRIERPTIESLLTEARERVARELTPDERQEFINETV